MLLLKGNKLTLIPPIFLFFSLHMASFHTKHPHFDFPSYSSIVDIFMWLVLVLLLCCSRFSYLISLFSHPFTHMHVYRGQFSIPYIFPSFDVQVYCSVSRVKWETRTKYFVSSAMSASGCSTIDSSTTKIRLISTASSVRWPVRTQTLCKMHKLLVSFYSFLHSVHIFICWRIPLFLTLILPSRQVF